MPFSSPVNATKITERLGAPFSFSCRAVSSIAITPDASSSAPLKMLSPSTARAAFMPR